MNYANPILICDDNEEFRILIRDMLNRNGFFHVIEAALPSEALDYLKTRDDYFVLIDSRIAGEEIIQYLSLKKKFLIFSDKSKTKTMSLAVKLGVDHVLSYPLTSRKLIEKIESLL
jgi:DNA-binding response OmpR family regulator